MSRKKLSEFRAKTLLFDSLGQHYKGLSIDTQDESWKEQIATLDPDSTYVIKVDQAEKQRFKKGLVKLDRQVSDLESDAYGFVELGYRYLLVEPFYIHDSEQERYLSLERSREGIALSFSSTGGIDIESHANTIKHVLIGENNLEGLEIKQDDLDKIINLFEDNYFSSLEINPFLLGQRLDILDAAVEVDDEADFFASGWTVEDLRSPRRQVCEEERLVQELSATSQASFSLERINENGSIFLLLSGGGASVMVADEVCNLGLGKELGNYGEYSGNPNVEEARLYTEQVIGLMLKSHASKKVLIVGGGVANFTDIRQTFKGVVEALNHHIDDIKAQDISIFVRRGGPYEKEGLAHIRSFLDENKIKGSVNGPELMLSEIVSQAIKELE